MSKEQERYLKIAVRNMYELENKRTDEIASELHISESKVILILEDLKLLNR